jgi:hypothetical protein
MTKHIRDVQILYRDEIGALDELGRFPMKPGVAGVGDLAVQSCHFCTRFMAAIAASLASGQRALPAAQFLLGPECNAWIGDHHVVAAPGEHFESEIDTDRRCHRALLSNCYLDLQADEPSGPIATEHA